MLSASRVRGSGWGEMGERGDVGERKIGISWVEKECQVYGQLGKVLGSHWKGEGLGGAMWVSF